MQALMQEYNRIIDSTKYNDRHLFTEDNQALVIQAGYGEENTLTALKAAPPTVFGTTRVSVDSAGNEAFGGNSSSNSSSADGRFVVFS
jgi:flagellin-like hook-associated protein FlgL